MLDFYIFGLCVSGRERDELMTALCTLRASQSEAQQREWAAYHQVKQAVEMAEEANLEKTKVSSNRLYRDDLILKKSIINSKNSYNAISAFRQNVFFSGNNIFSLFCFKNI